MNKLNKHTAYTDYPIEGNPDSKVIEVELLAYDRNKYVTVRRGDVTESVKSGYLYRDPAQARWIGRMVLALLPKEEGEKPPTRREIAAERKERRDCRTTYVLWVAKVRHPYATLAAVMRHFARSYATADCVLMRFQCRGYSSTTECVLEAENGHLVIPSYGRERPCFKNNHHYRKYFR